MTHLKWPFEGRIAISLVDKQPNSRHFTKEKYYKGEYKSGEATQLIICQDSIKPLHELCVEYQLLKQRMKTTISFLQKKKLRNLYEIVHTLNNPNSLVFPFDGNNTTIESKFYIEVSSKH